MVIRHGMPGVTCSRRDRSWCLPVAKTIEETGRVGVVLISPEGHAGMSPFEASLWCSAGVRHECCSDWTFKCCYEPSSVRDKQLVDTEFQLELNDWGEPRHKTVSVLIKWLEHHLDGRMSLLVWGGGQPSSYLGMVLLLLARLAFEDVMTELKAAKVTEHFQFRKNRSWKAALRSFLEERNRLKVKWPQGV